VHLLDVAELGIGGGVERVEQLLIADRTLALLLLQRVYELARRDDLDPAAQVAAAGVLRDRAVDEQPRAQPLRHLADQLGGRAGARTGARDLHEARALERGDRARVAAGARAREVDLVGAAAREIFQRRRSGGAGELRHQRRGIDGEVGVRGL